MKIAQIYTGCLAQGAYFISSNGEAVVIDPLRESTPYLEAATRENVKIKYIFETHFHADFVSGHVDLANKTGANIVFGPGATPNYPAHIAHDEEIFEVGNIKLKVLHTPGHTMESICILLYDEDNNPHSIYTGDTLFIGDVGRPDLAQKAGEITTEDLAGILYDSLHKKILPLPDHLIVYPAHGAGSACGKNMSKETYDLLGNQKQTNYALNGTLNKTDFVKELITGIPAAPAYFIENVKMNKMGYTAIDEVMQRGLKAIEPTQLELEVTLHNALILDTRSPEAYVKAHIPNSISIGIDGQFAPWVGALITDIKQAIVVVADEGREEEVVRRLARVGYDNTIGYLKGGISAWINSGKETENIDSITAAKFADLYSNNLNILDVRRIGEYNGGHITTATHSALDDINANMSKFDIEKTYYIHCAGGYRSVIFASILKARGFKNLINVEGGFAAIKQTSIPLN